MLSLYKLASVRSSLNEHVCVCVCFTYLLVDLNAHSGPDEATPLHLACRYNSGSATQLVLGKLLAINAKDAINFKDAKGRTPLHYATRRGHDMVIKVCVENRRKTK